MLLNILSAAAQNPISPGKDASVVPADPRMSAIVRKESQDYIIRKIRNDLNHKFLKNIFTGLLQLKEEKIAEILNRFSNADSNWGVWKLQEGKLPKYINATTTSTREGAVTIIDYGKLKDASQLSVARTLLHELIHVYLLMDFRFDRLNALKKYPLMNLAWKASGNPSLEKIHHAEMAEDFVTHISLALKEYSDSLGRHHTDLVYKDLAWGGLDFKDCDQLTEEDKDRIQERLDVEQCNDPVVSTDAAVQ